MITQKKLKSLVFYIPDTGKFMRLITKGNVKSGDIIKGNAHPQGYLRFSLQGVTYKYHKLVWMYHGGIYDDPITHIDGDKTNNRIGNLKHRWDGQGAIDETDAELNLKALNERHSKELTKAQNQIDRLQLVHKRELVQEKAGMMFSSNVDHMQFIHRVERDKKRDILNEVIARHRRELAEMVEVSEPVAVSFL